MLTLPLCSECSLLLLALPARKLTAPTPRLMEASASGLLATPLPVSSSLSCALHPLPLSYVRGYEQGSCPVLISALGPLAGHGVLFIVYKPLFLRVSPLFSPPRSSPGMAAGSWQHLYPARFCFATINPTHSYPDQNRHPAQLVQTNSSPTTWKPEAVSGTGSLCLEGYRVEQSNAG